MQNNSLPMPISDDLTKHAEAVWKRTPVQIGDENYEEQTLSFRRLFAEIKPQDFLEEEWVIDITDCTWNISRLRNLRAYLLNASMYLGLQKS